MTRRDFLKYTFLAGIALSLPVSLHLEDEKYILVGDGKTDCTLALQAYVDGKEVWIQTNSGLRKFNGYLPSGTYNIKKTTMI